MNIGIRYPFSLYRYVITEYFLRKIGFELSLYEIDKRMDSKTCQANHASSIHVDAVELAPQKSLTPQKLTKPFSPEFLIRLHIV